MKVSIVIPCFNHARYVGEAIESALAQDWRDVEVVVVNDGSTDQSASVIERAASRNSDILVVTQANQGLSAARNAGLLASRGEVLIFLDADDRLYPGAARAALASLTVNPLAMMTFGRCLLVDEAGAPMLTNLPVVQRDFYAGLLRRNYIWTPAMAAFRREVFGIVGPFRRSIDPSADYDMYLRITRLLPIASHDHLVAAYRQHGANMSRNPVAMLDATLTVLASQRPYVAAHPELGRPFEEGRRDWRAFYGEHLVERFRSALHAGNWSTAARHAIQLLRLYPRGVRRHLAKKARLTVQSWRRRRRDRAAYT